MNQKKEDIVWTIARHVANSGFENITRAAVDATKQSILDTLGVMVAASGISAECRSLAELVIDSGGKPESTIVGFGARVPAWMAAFVNGAMGHALDYDDLLYESQIHPSSPVVAASFALGERLGAISGRQLLTAVALGNDLSCRLTLARRPKIGWSTTTVLGVFGATAAAGKLLDLDAQRMVSAFGIALSEAAGTQEIRYSLGNHIGGMRDAYPARGGVLSALMAQRGIIGPENCFEGRAGLFNVYFGGEVDRQTLIGDIGRVFKGAGVGIKAWPTCGTSHVYLEATLKIVTEHDIDPQDIKSITLYLGDFAMLHSEPLAQRCRPQTPADAKYSIPFVSAIAATRRKVVLSDLTPEGIKDPAVLQMAKRVVLKHDARFNSDRGEPPGMVQIETRAGQSWSKQIDFGYGHPRNPISTADVIQKFRDCVSYAARPLSRTTADRLVDLVMNLEDVEDVGDIARLI